MFVLSKVASARAREVSSSRAKRENDRRKMQEERIKRIDLSSLRVKTFELRAAAANKVLILITSFRRARFIPRKASSVSICLES